MRRSVFVGVCIAVFATGCGGSDVSIADEQGDAVPTDDASIDVAAETVEPTDSTVTTDTDVHWNEIRKADPAALAPPTKLSNVESFPSALAIDATDVYWMDMCASGLGSIAVDATHVYFIDPKGNTVRKVPKAGGAAVTIATANDPRGLIIDANYVYWSNGGDGTIMRVAK